jgi:co-chaperonin GroES (HSP10)
MIPSPGVAFIIEEEKADSTESGIVLTHKNKSKGAIGYIYAVDGTVLCPHCQESCTRKDLKPGDHVIYSRFVAEYIGYREPDMPKGRLFSVPVDAILAKIS